MKTFPPPTRSMRHGAALIAAMFTALAVIAVPASAQTGDSYASVEEGQLNLEATIAGPNGLISVSGENFATDSPVAFSLVFLEDAIAIESAELTSNDDGVAAHEFTLPPELVGGAYLARLAGVTDDGSTLLLDLTIDLEGNIESFSQPTAPPTTSEATDSGSTQTTAQESSTSETVAATNAQASTATPTTQTAGDASDEVAAGTITSPGGDSSNSMLIIVIVVAIAALGGGAVVVAKRSTNA